MINEGFNSLEAYKQAKKEFETDPITYDEFKQSLKETNVEDMKLYLRHVSSFKDNHYFFTNQNVHDVMWWFKKDQMLDFNS